MKLYYVPNDEKRLPTNLKKVGIFSKKVPSCFYKVRTLPFLRNEVLRKTLESRLYSA